MCAGAAAGVSQTSPAHCLPCASWVCCPGSWMQTTMKLTHAWQPSGKCAATRTRCVQCSGRPIHKAAHLGTPQGPNHDVSCSSALGMVAAGKQCCLLQLSDSSCHFSCWTAPCRHRAFCTSSANYVPQYPQFCLFVGQVHHKTPL